jgi:hypothetical protein
MTPKETYMAIDAAIWRDERQQDQDMRLAWHMAAFMRTKRLPSLKNILASKPAKRLRGGELEEKRREYREMTAAVDLEAINRKMARKKR